MSGQAVGSSSEKEQEEQLHQIGEVAKRVGLSLRTVRYYEEAGLVRPSERTDGGFRLYGEGEIARLALVKRMKPLGFTIDEMRKFLAARDRLNDPTADDRMRERASAKLAKFAAETQQKCDELRSHLKNAEGFAAELQRDLRRNRRDVTAPEE